MLPKGNARSRNWRHLSLSTYQSAEKIKKGRTRAYSQILPFWLSGKKITRNLGLKLHCKHLQVKEMLDLQPGMARPT